MVNFSTYVHGLFILGMGFWMIRPQSSIRWRQPALFGMIFTYFLVFFGSNFSIFTMAGDNICQIAYWKILFHPNLTGSIGASYTKPGQLLILGMLYEVSVLFGEIVFKIGMCLIMAACVWCLMRIAEEIGGKEAGFFSILVAILAFRAEFLDGSFSLFLIPTLFSGFWFYYHKPEHKTLGRFLLVLSVQFHIQAAPVLGVLWLLLLMKREWKELWLFSVNLIGSLSVWLLLILRVQGGIERITSSGPSVGYIGSVGDAFTYSSKGEYLYKAVWAELSGGFSIAVLFILIAIGILGAWRYRQTHYLSIASILILLILNVLLLNGTFNLNRFFAVFYAFGCSVGIGSLTRFAREQISKPIVLNRLITGMALLLAVTLFTVMSTRQQSARTKLPFIDSAMALISDQQLPGPTRLMTEDDLLYPMVIVSPDRFPKLTALQRFNTATIPQRMAILHHTDYIWIVRDNRHQYYYLNYLPEPSWRQDPFRLLVEEIIRTDSAGSLYGYRFVPVALDRERLLVKVTSAGTEEKQPKVQ